MHLIHAKTLRLKTFPDHRTRPPYAILSHTWSDAEVLYKDILDYANDTARSGLDWKKIHGACQQASKDGFEYIWIDTCCIDKTSSAELSEAINSMFQWYQRSEVCYAYMPDVTDLLLNHESGSSFQRSRWFTRGWTLQELIAPSVVVFFDGEWKLLGDRESLSDAIHKITGLPHEILQKHRRVALHDYSVAMRMAWASGRQTTRIEDEAYCLLGLFDINMPLLYGEGSKAFVRLQEEIARVSNDHSIFAWEASPREGNRPPPREEASFFAPSPAYFSAAWTIHRVAGISHPEYEVSKRGLHMALRVRGQTSGNESKHEVGILDCVDINEPHLYIALAFEDEGHTQNGSKVVSIPRRRVLFCIDGNSTDWPHLAAKKDLLIVKSYSSLPRFSPNSIQLFVTRPLSAHPSFCSVSVHPRHEWAQHNTGLEATRRRMRDDCTAQTRVVDLMYETDHKDGSTTYIHFLVVFGCRWDPHSDCRDTECDVFLITSTCTDANIAAELSMAMDVQDVWVERNKKSKVEQHVNAIAQAQLPMESSFVVPQGMGKRREHWPEKASIRETTCGVDGRVWAIAIE